MASRLLGIRIVLACFFRHSGGIWAPAIYSTLVLLGAIASLRLMLSGLKGLIDASTGRTKHSRKTPGQRSPHPLLRGPQASQILSRHRSSESSQMQHPVVRR